MKEDSDDCCCYVASVVSDSVQPHRRQPARLPRPWDSPGKNTGVGCHFLLQCMKVKSESEIVQSCPTLSDPVDCSLPGSSIHGIFQARGLERGAIAFSSKTPGRCQTLGKQQGDCSPAMSGDKKTIKSLDMAKFPFCYFSLELTPCLGFGAA